MVMRLVLILSALLVFPPNPAPAAGVELSSAPSPGEPRWYVQTAAEALQRKDYAQAEKEATKAMELGWRKSSSFNARSAARTGLGHFKEAVADAEMSILVNPTGATPAGYPER